MGRKREVRFQGMKTGNESYKNGKWEPKEMTGYRKE
jgi:hypothetical protein